MCIRDRYYLASGKADEYFSRVALEAGDSLLSSYEPVIHETQLVLEPTLHISAPALKAAHNSAGALTGQDNACLLYTSSSMQSRIAEHAPRSMRSWPARSIRPEHCAACAGLVAAHELPHAAVQT